MHRVAQGELQSALHLVRHPVAVPQPAPAPHVPAPHVPVPAFAAPALAALPVPRVRRSVVIAPRPFTRSVARAQREAANT